MLDVKKRIALTCHGIWNLDHNNNIKRVNRIKITDVVEDTGQMDVYDIVKIKKSVV